MKIMRSKPSRFAAAALLATLLSVQSVALRPPPNKERVQAQAKRIEQIVAASDVTGLIEMLSTGEFPSKVTAAEHLGRIGDDTALPELKRLNEEHGGWVPREVHHDRSGAFAVAISRILTRDLSHKEQIDALFNLLQGKGPAVPESARTAWIKVDGVPKRIQRKLDSNIYVGKCVAAQLEKLDDPSVLTKLRKCRNKGVAVTAVWMEVRDMNSKEAIARCAQIARDEGGAQRYGATQCLGKFGTDAVEVLDQLAVEGHREAINVLAKYKKEPKVFEKICWHVRNNKNSQVRTAAVRAVAYVRTEALSVRSLEVLIESLYDPSELIRRMAARSISNRAYKKNKLDFDQVEDSLLVALKHPDVNVRECIMKALTRLECNRLDEQVPSPPPIRTNLEVHSKSPPIAEQKTIK
jgi:HEAT repeat protein